MNCRLLPTIRLSKKDLTGLARPGYVVRAGETCQVCVPKPALSLDWQARAPEFICALPPAPVSEILQKIGVLLAEEQEACYEADFWGAYDLH